MEGAVTLKDEAGQTQRLDSRDSYMITQAS